MNVHKWRIRKARCWALWLVLAPGSIYHAEVYADSHAEAVRELDRLRAGWKK